MTNNNEPSSDIMDDALESYFLTDEYKKQHKEINEKIVAFKKYLGPALLPEFLELLDMIDNANSSMVEAAFRIRCEGRTACEIDEKIEIE